MVTTLTRFYRFVLTFKDSGEGISAKDGFYLKPSIGRVVGVILGPNTPTSELYNKYGKPKILDTINVNLGIGDHQMTHILTNEEKLLEHINNLYISNKDYPYRLFIITDYLINEYKNIFLTTYLESIWQKHFIILNLEILKKNKIISKFLCFFCNSKQFKT